MDNRVGDFIGRMLLSAFVSSFVVAIVRTLNEMNKDGFITGDTVVFLLVMILLNKTIFKQ